MNNIRNYALHGARPSHLLPMIVMLLLMWIAPGLAYADDTTEPTLNDSSYYEISTAAQLKWFADKVNSGDNSINGVLTADIDVSTLDADYWTPIGLWDENGKTNIFYKGKFDGQNHTITGIVLRKAIASGLFGATQSATVSNVIVTGAKMKATRDEKISTIQYGIGPVCGIATAGTVIENCHSTLTEILYKHYDKDSQMDIDCVGGVVGELRESTAKDCSADGFVRTDGTSVGGIVGFLNSGLVQNCQFRNYDNGNSAVVGIDKVGGIAGSLQGRSRANAIVDCTVADSVIYNATAGVCDTICAKDTLLTEPGVFNSSYEIYTPDQLKWFSETVNAGNAVFNAKLMNDINMSKAGTFTPIGTSSKPFSLIFDGQEHTIDSLTISGIEYAGLFGYVKDGGIKNVNLDHTLLNTAGKNYQGLLVGFLTQDANDKDKKGYIENCNVVNGNLARDGSSTSDYVGGIVGKVDMSAEVRDCTFQGEVKGHEDRIGGIAGYMDSGAKMYRCTTIGPSTVWGNNYVGGVVGYMTDTQTLIDNCYADQSAGEVAIHASDNCYSGLVRGYDKSGTEDKSKYKEENLQYELTGYQVKKEAGKAKEAHITATATEGKGTYHAIVDIGSTSKYFTTEIERIPGVEELDFWDNNSNIAGTEACGWINMNIADYAFDSGFKKLWMKYKMFAGDDHIMMLQATDVRPVGDNMFGNCPDAKIYVDAEYYAGFLESPSWSKYKDHIVSTTDMRTEEVNALYGARYAFDRDCDKTGSIITVDNGSKHGSKQVHVIGADNSYLTAANNYTLWIYQDIGETYDYNTTKIWANSFKGNENVHTVKFQEITKSADRASQAFHIAVGDSAFVNCKNLTSFNVALYSDDENYHTELILPSQMPLGKGVFAGCDNLKIFVPSNLLDDFKNDELYGWGQYKDKIYAGDFGNGSFTELGVEYTYYTSDDGKTRYTSANNAPMENMLAPWVSKYRNFLPAKVLQYNSTKIKYVYASGVNEKTINDNGGKMCIYSDIGETLPNYYKTLALSTSGFQDKKCIKKITFEDIKSNNYNTLNDFTFVIPDRCFSGCTELTELTLFYLCTKGTNHYVAFKPSQIFIGEHVFDNVSKDFRIRVLPEYYSDFINDPNWSQYKNYIVAADYLPTTEKEKDIDDVTYDYATKVINGLSVDQVVSMKSSAWNAAIIGVEAALAIGTAGVSAAPSMYADLALNATDRLVLNTLQEFFYKTFVVIADYGVQDGGMVAEFAMSKVGAAIATNVATLGAGVIVGSGVDYAHSDVATNYIANQVKKMYTRPGTWELNGQWLMREDVQDVPQMYVSSVKDKETVTIYNDIGTSNDDFHTVAIAYSAFHNKKNLKTLKFQERYGSGSRSLAKGMTLALPDSMFVGCDNFETLDLINYTTGAHSENHAYKSLTPNNFIPMGDIFAGVDKSKIKIKVGKDVINEFLEDDYWSKYKDMFEPCDVSIVNKQTEWSCNYALAYDKNTLPLRTTVSSHDIDHVMIYGADDATLKSNGGLAALLNDFGNWNNYKLDYVAKGAFKGNDNLQIVDICDTHTNTSKVYTSFDVMLEDSAFAHCKNFTDLNLIYQVTVGSNHTESMSPSQFTLGNGVFDDTPKLKIKFCLDQENAFLADTAWVKYKNKFAPCFFEPLDEKVGKILLHPYRFLTSLNDGTNFDHVDATRAKPEDLKELFKGKGIESFDEFRAFASCGLTEVYDDMFSGCSKLQTIMLPDSITTIGSNAFKDCSLLYNLTIPAKVTSIKENAFTGSGISTFTMKSAVPADIDAAKVFAGLTNADTYIIYVPDNAVDTYKAKWSAVADHINGISQRRGLVTVKLDEAGTLAEKLGLTYDYTENILYDNHLYGNYAQYDSLRIIGPIDGRDIGVLRYMGGRDVDDNEPTIGHLKYLDLYEADLKSAGGYTYNRAYLIRGNSVNAWHNQKINNDNEVSDFMFWGLEQLETLILPKSATRMEVGAIEYCTNLKTLVVGDNMNYFQEYLSLNTPNKVAIVMLNKKAPEAHYYAFYPAKGYHTGSAVGADDRSLSTLTDDNSRFTAAIVPYNSVNDYSAVAGITLGCDSIIPNFQDEALVEALKKQHIFSPLDMVTVKNISGMLNGNTEIQKIKELYYSSVTELGDNTLTGMTGLKEMHLPIYLQKITKNAFANCKSLREIYAFGMKVPELESGSFDDLPKDFVVYVAEGTEDAYRTAWPEYKDHIQSYRAARVDIREITLTEPNTLADALNATFKMDGDKIVAVGGDLSGITGLKINGPIGGKDIALIRYLGGREPDWNEHVYTTKLKYLDLYNAELKKDNYYFLLRWNNRKIENDNEVPKDMLWSCDNLETVIMPRTATKLCYEACYDMYSLKTLVIGDKTTEIDDDALGECRNLEDIIFLCESKPTLDGDAFTDVIGNDNRKVKRMFVRKSLIQDYSNDVEYTDHTNQITAGFTDIDEFRAFGCKAIATEDDLASITKIDGWFDLFPNVTKLDMLNKTKITNLSKGTMDNLTNLQQVALPSTLSTIDKGAFSNNTNLHWVDLSECDTLKSAINALDICPEALVYQPSTFDSSSSDNVVSVKDGALWCSSYHMTDKFGYDVPKAFTAGEVIFGREFTPYTYSTIMLPFDVNISQMTKSFLAYTLDTDNTKSGELHFKRVQSMKANTPYVLRAKTNCMEIDYDNISVPVTPARSNVVTATDYIMDGSLQPISEADAKDLKILVMNDSTKLWNLFKASESCSEIPPYTGYVRTNTTTASSSDVQTVIADNNYYYYIGDVKHPLDGSNTDEDPLSCNALNLVDGLDFKSEYPFRANRSAYSRTMNNTWGTLCLPYSIDASINPDYKIYEVTGITDSELVIKELTGTVEAGRPVLLRSRKKGATITLNASEPTQVLNAVSTDVNGHIVGSYVETTLPNSSYFIASDKFWLTDNYQGTKIKGFRGYVVNNEQGAKASSLTITEEGDATAIDKLNAIEDDTNAIFYDANGRRTDGLQKGVNIIKRGDKVTKVVID